MRNTLLATVALAIGLLACADDHTPTGTVDPGLPVFDVDPTPPLFADGFESGTLATWDDGANPSYHRIITDATLARSGSRLLEVTFPAGGEGSWLTKFLLPGHQSVHVSYWIRYPATWRGGGYLLGVYGSQATNQWSAHGKAGVCPTGQDFFTSFVFADDGDPGPLRFSTYHPAMPRTGTQCWGDEGASTIYSGTGLLTRDAWHRVEFFVRANTPGVANGVQRLWIDGALRGEWTGLRFRETTNLVISSIQLSTYSATPATQTQRLYIDDVVVTEVPTPNAVASIEVSPSSSTLAVGASTQLTATARDAAGVPLAGTSFTWSSSNPAIVSVSSSGQATALAGGAAEISASAGGISGRATVTVSGGTAVASVSVVPGTGSVQVGQSLQFVATPRDAAGNPLSGRTVTWTSSDPAVATVSADGRAVGVSAGTTVLRATSEGQSGTASLTVTGGSTSPAPVAMMTISPAMTSVQPGATVQYTVTLRDAGGNVLSGRAVTWYSNHPGYARIDANGLATALNPGTAHIVAISEGVNATASLTVSDAAPPPPPPPPSAPVALITLAPAHSSAAVGETVQFTATLRDAAGNILTGRSIFWYSNHPGYASMDANGLATARNPGVADIVAISEGIGATTTLTVTSSTPPPPPPPPPPGPVALITLAPTGATAQVGQSVQFTATLRDAAGNILTGRTVTWYSNHPGYANIDGTGLATARNPGVADIVALSEGIGASTTLTVTSAAPAPVATVSVVPTTASVQAGQTVQLAATLRDAAGNILTGRPVTWSSSNTGIATVSSSGVVTGVSTGGPVTITATSEGRSGTSAVTVTAAPPAPVATVTVTPATGSIGQGQTLQLSATLRDAAGNVLTGRPITWTTSSAAIATVSNTGLVTGVAAGGPVTITATSEGRSGSAAVTVTAPPPPPPPAPVASVTLSPPSASIAPGQTLQLAATLRDAAGNVLTGRVITWASSNPLVVTVAPGGLVAGVTSGGPVTITATSEGQSGTASITVTTTSVGTTLFESDWRTATGTSTTALRDGTKWSEWVNYGGPQLLSVVPATGLGFPSGMANVLRVLQMGEQDAEHMQLTNGIPAPQVGSHLYYRIYTRVDEAAQSGGSDHPVEPMPGACPFLWTFKRSIGATGWRPEWQFSNTPSEEWWSLRVQLQKNAVYRIEWHFHFITSSTFKFDTRIYDAAGTLLYTDADFLSGNFLNQTLLARDPNFRNTNNDCFRHLFVGNNGQANWTATNTYTYWGGVKVCRDGWCGAY